MHERAPDGERDAAAPDPTWAAQLGVPLLFFLTFFGVGATQTHLRDYGMALAARGGELTRLVFGEQGWNLTPLLVATIYLVFAPSRLLGVWVISRLGRTWTIRIGAALYLVLTVTLYARHSVWLVLAGCATIGVGAGLLWTASATHVLDQATRKRYGFFSAVLHLLTRCGMALGTFVLGALVERHGYFGHSFFPFGVSICGGAAAVGLAMLLRSPPVQVRAPTRARVIEALQRPGVRKVGALLFLAVLGYGLLLSHVLSVVRKFFQNAGVPWLACAYFVSGLIFVHVGGWLSDRIGRWPVLLGSYACGGVSMALFAEFTPEASPWLPAAAMFLLGVPFGAVPVASMAWVGDVADPRDRPLVHAVTFFWRDLGVVTAAVLTLWLGRPDNLKLGFAALAVLFFLPAILGGLATLRRA